MVIFTGIRAKDLEDPHMPPEGVEGPYTVSGNNRFDSQSTLMFLLGG